MEFQFGYIHPYMGSCVSVISSLGNDPAGTDGDTTKKSVEKHAVKKQDL